MCRTSRGALNCLPLAHGTSPYVMLMSHKRSYGLIADNDDRAGSCAAATDPSTSVLQVQLYPSRQLVCIEPSANLSRKRDTGRLHSSAYSLRNPPSCRCDRICMRPALSAHARALQTWFMLECLRYMPDICPISPVDHISTTDQFSVHKMCNFTPINTTFA